MLRKLTMSLVLAAAFIPALVAPPAPVAAQSANCQYTLGFRTLHDMIPQIAGDCIENEWHNAFNGDGLQRTTGGLMVWRKSDNWTAFTNGYQTWINGPIGLQARLNTERFPWENDMAAPAPTEPGFTAAPAPAPSSPAQASPAPTATPSTAAPDLSVRLSDERVNQGESFTVRLEASSDAGIESMWWWATSTDDNDLRDTHTMNCRSSTPCRRSWDLSTSDTGTITIHAKARDENGNETDEITRELRVRQAS